jgi:hypothetical protein
VTLTGTMTDPFRYRDENGDLRLDELLGERYVRHYVRVLESSSDEFRAMQLAAAVDAPPQDAGTAWSAWQEPDPQGRMVDGRFLLREGTGPDDATSTQVLARYPEIIWDVCGYYRRLGFDWREFRRARAKQIRMRYLALDPRQEDEPLFYAATQLLDPLIRRAYDAQPLGGLFLGDRDVRVRLEELAAREASRLTAEARRWDPDGTDEPVRQEDILRGWGMNKDASPEDARERLAASALGATLEGSWERAWSYYVLAEPGERAEAPEGLLEAWQQLVCAALSEAGATVRFAVGYRPGLARPLSWRDSNECCIFFTGDGLPDREQAAQAVREFLGL